MPRRSLSFLARPGGLPVPVGCLVLSVWPRRAFLSCLVLSCLFSPGGLLIPPDYPREFFWGGRKGSGCRGRAEGTEAKARRRSAMASWAPSSQLRHGLQSAPPPARWNCYGVGHAFREGGFRTFTNSNVLSCFVWCWARNKCAQCF